MNYVADAAGYRAAISSNEPGVEPKDPASATINKAAIIAAPVVAAPLLAAPAPLHYAAAAPVANIHVGASGSTTTVNHAAPARLVAAPALHAPWGSHLVAANPWAAPIVAAPVVAAPTHWGYNAAW